ncbi:DgyrCDS7527 [Dimorphilus gyrociliatus]|uniref:PRKCA-binding protein n=1 Tax=Dimorphilus gyrociliatus TaxID=2664684 RepID=A0A7I8VRG4_9ANNE|nr:DgyrCDS7527 [Dimorphilus gyrociliatus]
MPKYSYMPVLTFDPDIETKMPRIKDYNQFEDRMGMTVTSGTTTLRKSDQNLVGISIGGGSPLCPCVFIVQVFDNTPASIDGTLAAGDEIVAIEGKSVKGRSKVEVARMIQSVKDCVKINYNKLHADPKQGKTLDIVLKKIKHKVVEGMSASTADALGLSRAILCNDSLVKKLGELERTAEMYKGMVDHTKEIIKCFLELSNSHRDFGDIFSEIGVREPQPAASKAFSTLGEAHRNVEKSALQCLSKVKPVVQDLNTFLNKAVPDTKLTVKKYLDVKFEYLSYCLKVKEMDDEEYAFNSLGEPLYRVETGNYEYRLILRCRQLAKKKFANLRSDVLVKLELLDQKHVQDVVFQLQRLITAMSSYHTDCHEILKGAQLFPIEVDLAQSTLSYTNTDDNHPDEDGDEDGEEVDEQSHTRVTRPDINDLFAEEAIEAKETEEPREEETEDNANTPLISID